MSRLYNKYFCLVLILFVTRFEAMAQVTAPVNATGHVIAEIIPIFSASETSQMNFGRFAPGPMGGQIILTPYNSISVLGSVFTGAGTHNAASFYVSGDVDAAYSITLPTAPVVLTHMTSAKTMLIKDWVSVPSPGIGAGRLQNGFQIVNIGATLNVGTLLDNPVGVYTGSFTITFDFN
jgi:hypothetical protein